MEARFSKVEHISEVMAGYITHGGSGRTIVPRALSGPAPAPGDYLRPVTEHWISRNRARVVNSRMPEWLEPEELSA